MLEITENIYAGIPIPGNINNQTILNMNKNRWLRCSAETSRQIRLLLKEGGLITSANLTTFTADEAKTIYKNTNKQVN